MTTLPAQWTVTAVNAVRKNVINEKSADHCERNANAEPNNVGTKLADNDHGLKAKRYVFNFINVPVVEVEVVALGVAAVGEKVVVVQLAAVVLLKFFIILFVGNLPLDVANGSVTAEPLLMGLLAFSLLVRFLNKVSIAESFSAVALAIDIF